MEQLVVFKTSNIYKFSRNLKPVFLKVSPPPRGGNGTSEVGAMDYIGNRGVGTDLRVPGDYDISL